MNAEFQRTARKDKAFLNEQWKETEENNTMGKIRDFFKKIGAIKGIFQVRMSTVKDRNREDLTEAEEIKRRWQENTEYYTKKVLMNQITTTVCISPRARHSGMWSQRALESITINKASGGGIIPGDLSQILKDDAALNMSENLENSSGATVLKKSQFSFQSQRRAMSKNVSTSVQLWSFHMLAR